MTTHYQRIANLRSAMTGRRLDALLVTEANNYRYLTGFTGTAGFLLITADATTLATDFIHIEQARMEVSAPVETVRVKSMTEGLPGLLDGISNGVVGFDPEHVTFAQYRRLESLVGDRGLQLVPAEGMVESLRAQKDSEEIACIETACEIADKAMDFIAARIHAGMSEKQAAWELNAFLHECGSEDMAFDIIVASGRNAALPHARPTSRAISEGEPVVIDLGARVGGYCSDLSRTLCVGPRPERLAFIYEVVLKAQTAALEEVSPGMKGDQADGVARKIIQEAGLAEFFGHGLGHGVGLAVHEQPRLGVKSDDILVENMVVTIEPGIYVPGWGGVRIEDTVIVRASGLQVLTNTTK